MPTRSAGFGRAFPASLALTPYDRGASPLAWAPRAAAPQLSPTSPARAPAPALDLDALLDQIRTALGGFLGERAPDGAPAAAGPASGTGPSRPERDGRPSANTVRPGATSVSTPTVPAVRSAAGAAPAGFGIPGRRPAAAGGLPAATAGIGSSTDDLAGWNMGPVDMTYAGPALSALGAVVPGAGLLGLLGNGYNLAQYSDTMAAEGIPGLSLGQVLGGLLGWNAWGQGTADPLANAFDVVDGRYTLKPDVGRPDLRNPGFGRPTAGEGSPTDIRPRVGGPSAGRGSPGTDDRSQIAAGIGPGSGEIY